MCQFLQNSVNDFEKYGVLKLVISLKPSNLPSPIAMSEYPEKSQYIWNAKNIVAINVGKPR